MVIRLTAATTMSWVSELFTFATNVLCPNRSDVHRLFDKAIKQQSTKSGGSTIKPKNKFIQIVIQMRRSWRTLMSSLQPALQQRDYQISQRQQIITDISRFTNNRMFITKDRQLTIAIPIIGTYFAFRLNTFFNHWYQAFP